MKMKKCLTLVTLGLSLLSLASCGEKKEASVISSEQQDQIEKETVGQSLTGVGMLSDSKASSSVKGLHRLSPYSDIKEADNDTKSGSDTVKATIAGAVKSYLGDFSYALDVNVSSLQSEKSDKAEYDHMYQLSLGSDDDKTDFTLYYKSALDASKSNGTYAYYDVDGLLASKALDISIPLKGSFEGKVEDDKVKIASNLQVSYDDNNYVSYAKSYDDNEYQVDVTLLGKRVYSEKLAYDYTDDGNFSITVDRSSDAVFAYTAKIEAKDSNTIAAAFTLDIPVLGKTTLKASLSETKDENGNEMISVLFDGDTTPYTVAAE